MLYHKYTVLLQAITISLSSDESYFNQLSDDVAETKKMCQTLLDRQASFEKLVMAQLGKIESYLQDLIVLAPPPFSSMPARFSSTPKASCVQQQSKEETISDMDVLTGEPTPTEAPPTAACLEDITNSTPQGSLEASKLSSLRASSCSRENFATKLVKELFSVEERLTSNVRGVLGKKKYNEKIMAYVQELTFNSYPCPLTEKKSAWAKCIKAIDSAGRVFCRKTAKAKEN